MHAWTKPHVFSKYKLQTITGLKLMVIRYQGSPCMQLHMECKHAVGHNWCCSAPVHGVGVERVRTVQRWWRRRSRQYKERAMAFMMGGHRRLGVGSGLRVLDDGVMRMCVGW